MTLPVVQCSELYECNKEKCRASRRLQITNLFTDTSRRPSFPLCAQKTHTNIHTYTYKHTYIKVILTFQQKIAFIYTLLSNARIINVLNIFHVESSIQRSVIKIVTAIGKIVAYSCFESSMYFTLNNKKKQLIKFPCSNLANSSKFTIIYWTGYITSIWYVQVVFESLAGSHNVFEFPETNPCSFLLAIDTVPTYSGAIRKRRNPNDSSDIEVTLANSDSTDDRCEHGQFDNIKV